MNTATFKRWLSLVLCGTSLLLLAICMISYTTNWFHATHRAYWLKQQQPRVKFVAGVLDHHQIRISWIRRFNAAQDQFGEFWYFKFGQSYLVEFDDARVDQNNPPYQSSAPSDITIIVELGLAIHHLAIAGMIYPCYFCFIRYRRRRIRGSFDCCQNCRYNLTGNESDTCPECGEPIETVT